MKRAASGPGAEAPRTHAQWCPARRAILSPSKKASGREHAFPLSPLLPGHIWERGNGGEEDRLGNRTGLQSSGPSWSTLTIPSLRKRSRGRFVGRLGERKNRDSDLLDLVFLLSRNPFPSNSMRVEKVSGREPSLPDTFGKGDTKRGKASTRGPLALERTGRDWLVRVLLAERFSPQEKPSGQSSYAGLSASCSPSDSSALQNMSGREHALPSPPVHVLPFISLERDNRQFEGRIDEEKKGRALTLPFFFSLLSGS